MANMDKTGVPIALVVDFSCDELLGTLTDGDVRRWILGGGGVDAEVSAAMNGTPHMERSDGGSVPAPVWCTLVPIIDHRSGRLVGLRDLRPTGARQNAVVIMAGGLGTRLRPLTEDIPKPMIEVGGKPIIQRLVECFVAQGFRDVWISVGYKAEAIKAFFGETRFGARISYLEEDSPLGTAGALALLPAQTSPTIVVNGDVVTDVDFRKLLDFHVQSRAPATMAVRSYKMRCDYGVAQVQPGTTSLESIIEKPDIGVYVNAGIYVMEPDALRHVSLNNLKMTDVFSLMAANLYTPKPAVFPLTEMWLDVGSHAELERARKEFGGNNG